MSDVWMDICEVVSGYKSPLHEPVSFQIKAGELIGIAGSNGVGKSTLLRSLMNLVPCHSGHITTHKNSIPGYQPQENRINSLVPLTGQDLLDMQKPTQLRPAYADLLDKLDVTDLLHNSIRNLSGGEKQRLLLARSILSNADLLIWDEPDNHLDRKRLLALEEFIGQVRSIGSFSLILTSHRLLTKMNSSFSQIIELYRQET